MRRREVTIPTLLGLLVAGVGLATGLWLLRGQIRNQASASAEEAPINVRTTNVSDTSFTVSWTSATSISGYVQYAEGTSEPDLVVSDERDQQRGSIGNYFTHYVTVRGLRPTTQYQFKVGSGSELYGNGDAAYQVTTGVAVSTTPAADVAYGQVVTESNEPAEGALVYLTMDGVAPQSALVRSSGSWVLPLATARTTDLRTYATYNKETDAFQLEVDGGPMGTSTATVSLKNDAPVAQITLGQNFTFTDGKDQGTNKFRTMGGNISQQGDLKLTTPQTDERVNNFKPVIVGQAPAGTTLTIEVHSDQVVSGSAVSDATGQFTYTVPSDLAPGPHTVTISGFINGVLQTVTTSFVVYAAGESTQPYYQATPSASMAPTPTSIPTTLSPTPKTSLTPTLSPTPISQGTTTITTTPSPTKTPTPTVPPRTYNPATDSSLPQTGAEDFTFIALAAGLLLTAGGAAWYMRVNRL